MKTYARYAEHYQRRKAPQAPIPSSSNETYSQFLEVQLEKVSNALLQTKDFEERVIKLETSSMGFEDKMSKFMNMVRLLQTFAEAQERENHRNEEIKVKIEEYRLKAEENRLKTEENRLVLAKIEPLVFKLEGKVKVLEKGFDKGDLEGVLDRFREEINRKIEMVMGETQKSALNTDLEQLARVLEEERREREALVDQIGKDSATRDKISNDLLEDIMKKYKRLEEELQGRLVGDGLSNTKEESHFNCMVNLAKIEKELDDLRYSNHVINGKISKNIQQVSVKDLQVLEKTMVQQFSKGLDQFGEMIKKYVNNQNNLIIRLNSIENAIIPKPPIRNPFTQNKENLSLHSNQKQQTILEPKSPNFQKTKDLLDSSSDLEELLINKNPKKPKKTEKTKKKRSRSTSNPKIKEKPKLAYSSKKERKISPESRTILNRISIERKEKEKKIKSLIKNEKKPKKNHKIT